MNKNYVKTSRGVFTCFSSEEIKQNKPTLVFFAAMGINSAYLDFYNLFTFLDESKYNLISVDMLGSGFSSDPVYHQRTLENYSKEVSELLAKVGGSKLFIVSHSFSAVYLLNILHQKQKDFQVSGLIGIDPTAPKIMLHDTDQLNISLNEAKQSQKSNQGMDTDINPWLTDPLVKKAKKIYQKKSGNFFEIDELKEAVRTLKKTQDMKIGTELPTLSILSALNYPDYIKWGNPYFNENNASIQLVLNGHHFLQWLHPQLIAGFISFFVDNLI